MKIRIEQDGPHGDAARASGAKLASGLAELGFDAFPADPSSNGDADSVRIRLIDAPAPADSDVDGEGRRLVALDGPETLLERAVRALPLDFDSLPLLVEGESKVVRAWTEKIVAVRFKPTVYSFTHNRYGEVPGTDAIRARFTAALFRRMAAEPHAPGPSPRSAFVAEVASPRHGPLIIERRVADCNLETRVKRYHVGSPVHRYRYTEKHPTTQAGGPLARWSRLETPVVCFDWRHPLRDDEGRRLADEPLSDDYAAVWMRDVPHAKEMARQTFLWMERTFEEAGLRLIDMCLFIDREGKTIYGEISPDCMRVRLNLGDPSEAEAADKDLWRDGRSPDDLRSRYEELYGRLFVNNGREK